MHRAGLVDRACVAIAIYDIHCCCCLAIVLYVGLVSSACICHVVLLLSSNHTFAGLVSRVCHVEMLLLCKLIIII